MSPCPLLGLSPPRAPTLHILCGETPPGGWSSSTAHSEKNKPLDDPGQGYLLLLLVLHLLENSSSSSPGTERCQSSRTRSCGRPGHPEQLKPGRSSRSPSKGTECLFLGSLLSCRKDSAACQGFYWIPVKGIQRLSCLLSFPEPAQVQGVFYPGVGGRDGLECWIWLPALQRWSFKRAALSPLGRRHQGWKSTERGLERVERSRTFRLKKRGKCWLSSSPPSRAGDSTRPGLDKVLTVLGGNLEIETLKRDLVVSEGHGWNPWSSWRCRIPNLGFVQ